MLAVDGWVPERPEEPFRDLYQRGERVLRALTVGAAIMLLSAAAAASML